MVDLLFLFTSEKTMRLQSRYNEPDLTDRETEAPETSKRLLPESFSL